MSVITEPFREEIAKDGVSPPWLVMEWYFVEAMANLRADNGINSSRIPGIDKARQAVADKVPLSSSRYLKTPKVFGYHGVYKRLGKYLDVVNEDFGLGESGYRLLCIWEKEQGLAGFCDQTATNGAGCKNTPAVARGSTRRDGIRADSAVAVAGQVMISFVSRLVRFDLVRKKRNFSGSYLPVTVPRRIKRYSRSYETQRLGITSLTSRTRGL